MRACVNFTMYKKFGKPPTPSKKKKRRNKKETGTKTTSPPKYAELESSTNGLAVCLQSRPCNLGLCV